MNNIWVSRMEGLYDTNEPGIRNLVEICDVYLNIYNQLKNQYIITNSTLTNWYNTWKNDASLNQFLTSNADPSLNDVYANNKNMIKTIQDILTAQYNFTKSVKGFRLPNGDTAVFSPNIPTGSGTTKNQVRLMRARYNMGAVSNIGIDISSTDTINCQTLDISNFNLQTNRYITKYYYQIGTFPIEGMVLDTWNGGTTPTTLSVFFKNIMGFIGDDGAVGPTTSIYERNNRLIEQLTFSINMINDLKRMLTYFA
jgi:hypothetical protein